MTKKKSEHIIKTSKRNEDPITHIVIDPSVRDEDTNTQVVIDPSVRDEDPSIQIDQQDVELTHIEPAQKIYCPLLCNPGADILTPCMEKRCGFFNVEQNSCSILVISKNVRS